MTSIAVLLCTAVLSCGGDSSTGTRKSAPASLLIVSGDGQHGTVGQELPDPLVVRLRDANGDPVRGFLVNFRVVAGNGSVFAGSALTNDAGEARERWTLGTTAGETQKVEARAIDQATGEPLVFGEFTATAVAAAPASIAIASGDGQQGVVGAVLPNPVTIRVADQYGNAVSGATVQWSAEDGGSVAPASSNTGVDGRASTAWTLGSAAGEQHASATVTGLAPVALTATAGAGAPASMEKVAGDLQTGRVSSELPVRLEVRVRDDAGNGASAAAVTWSVSGNGKVASVNLPSSDRSSMTWRLGTTTGEQTATAHVDGVPDVTFTATATAYDASKLVLVSGDAQSGTVGTALAQPLTVAAVDPYGNRVPGVNVTWSVLAGSPVLSQTTTVTDADGAAAVTVTMPTRTGTQKVRASMTSSVYVDFTMTAAPGPLAQIIKNSGDGQAASPGSTLPTTLSVIASDQYGNGISGLPVAWVVTSGGGTISGASTTSSGGYAGATWTIGPATGANTAEARIGSVAPAVFTATGTSASGWVAMASSTTSTLNAIWGSSASDAFAVGANGTIVHFDGTSWTTMSSGTTVTLRRVWGRSHSEVYATDDVATLLRYDGTSWRAVSFPPRPPGFDNTDPTRVVTPMMWVASPTVALAAVENRTRILRWNGATWTEETQQLYGAGVVWIDLDGRAIVGSGYTNTGQIDDGTGWRDAGYALGTRITSMLGPSFDDLLLHGTKSGSCCTVRHWNGRTTDFVDESFPMGWIPLWYTASGELYVGVYDYRTSRTRLGRVTSFDNYAPTVTDEGFDATAMWGSSDADLFVVGPNGTIWRKAK